ncbi:alpha/beta-hydrolase [Multifurca ochricompacta]|uniref:Alpha/beta-hydrolase n=1 Tax=Multifurca ochricompacta TaxID=376703 RepID=A0AAD4M3P9_9AGAM|nr:alpha/beta-hydrolase [Multifurca ochricompacta]
MDPSAYKKLTVSRGLTYNYYYAKATEGSPTLVLLHGKGFGLIVPDLLGYGGTDKPSDPKKYVPSGLAQDIVDILDAEGVQVAVAIGHDWGSRVVSRLANDKPERFSGFAFLTVGYLAPRPDSDPVKAVELFKQLVGRDVIGYWNFFYEEGADKIIENHFDSFFSLFFPQDPNIWVEHIGVRGATKAWLEADRQAPLPSYITPEDKEHYREVLLSGGLAGPLQWYHVMSSGALAEDDKLVPPERIPIQKPTYFGACTKDQVCLPPIHTAAFKTLAKGPFTLEEFATDHWLLFSVPDQVNSSLLKWIETL